MMLWKNERKLPYNQRAVIRQEDWARPYAQILTVSLKDF